MNILAFDTCFGAVSAALRWRSARGEWMLREAYEARTTGHAERLFPMIADIMDGAGVAFSALDRIAVTLGPGTFTGVRAGVAAARAFALAAGKPVVGMTSLAVMALRAELLLGPKPDARPLAVAVDARRDMLYFQMFGDDATPAGGVQLLSAEQAACAIGHRPARVAGSGAALVAAAAGRHVEALLADLQPHARLLALAAADLAPIDPVMPLYLRPPDAKPPADPALFLVQP